MCPWIQCSLFSYFYLLTYTLNILYLFIRGGTGVCAMCMCVPLFCSRPETVKLLFFTMWSRKFGSVRLGGKYLYPLGLVLLLPMHSLYLNFVSGKYTTELWALCTPVEILSLTLSEGSRLFIHVNVYVKFCIWST